MKRYTLYIISFVSGMAIIAMETSSVRLLAPYVGTSQFVWTNVIGVVLAALALGYFVGGSLADKKPEIGVLSSLIVIAGMIFFFIPFIVRPLASFISTATILASGISFSFFLSLSLVIVLFAFPLVLLGMVSPFLIRLAANDTEHIGETAGNLYAVSTIGSILGTFLPTMLIIPWIGTRLTIQTFAVLLVLVALLGFSKRMAMSGVLVSLMMLVGATAIPEAKASTDTIVQKESQYHFIRIDEDDAGIRYLYFNEGLGVQSLYHPSLIFVTNYYFNYFSLLPQLIDADHVDMLILGLAGGTIARQIDSLYGDRVAIDGVEIDPVVTELANEYMGLGGISNLQTITEDGRIYLERTDKKYDVIVVDAYQHQYYIPFTLTTREFWKSVSGRLSDNGMLSINIAALQDSDLMRAIINTIASVFDTVVVIPVDDTIATNSIVVAGNREIDLSNPEDFSLVLSKFSTRARDAAYYYTYSPDEIVLTDDHAPIEFLTDSMFARVISHE